MKGRTIAHFVQGGFQRQCSESIDCTKLTLQAHSFTSLTPMGALNALAHGVCFVWNYSLTQPVGIVSWYRSAKPEQTPVVFGVETAEPSVDTERERSLATTSPTASVLKRRCVPRHSSTFSNAKLYV